MEHILDIDTQASALEDIFKKIRDAKAILFLGAGASVGEKRYLSKEIITYYEHYLQKTLNEGNITNFVDILSADDTFSRKHFDNFVADMLRKLTITEAHKTLASIPWREIITTNYDLLIEGAYDAISNTSDRIFDIKPIRNLKQLNYKETNTEVKYIKLNGCIQDIGLYPLAFSTDDFQRLKPFYKNVLNDLRNPADELTFISIGYSYSDEFGKRLLEKFDDYNFRERRWMFNVDPYPNISALPFYTKNKICIIKCSFEEFFLKYSQWEQKQITSIVKRKSLSVSDSKNQYITVPQKLLINLDGVVTQLNNNTNSKVRFVRDSEYYKGEEPNFGVILRELDVVKSSFIANFIGQIKSNLKNVKGTLLPVFFIYGDFGIGKSTFTLRLIHELERDTDLDVVAFEILDPNRVKKEWLIELISFCKSKHVIFYCDEIEIESYFKSLLDLQRELSIEQIQGCDIFFIAPIRENILEKYTATRTVQNSFYLKLDGKFTENEVDELLEKLTKAQLLQLQDAAEKKRLKNKIVRDYDSDSFIALMSIVTSGRHENDLIDSYNQLSQETQRAFLFTALLHKYKLPMPASWLKQNISMNWDEFEAKVIRAEGKGILIQELVPAYGTQPDLYFRTKHPLIAAKLADRIIPNKDSQYKFYERMLKTIETGQTNSYLANNLLKALQRSEEYNEIQINKLFDSGYTKLSDDPFFLLNYAINLQYRGTILDLKRGLDILVYAESLLDYRHHYFIHRRGVISFELAKLFYEDDTQVSATSFYLREAEDLFITKQLLDPFSSYSYADYIKLLIWELKKIEHEKEDEIQKQIQIEELFDTANRTVDDGMDRIEQLYSNYVEYLSVFSDGKEHKEYLDQMYLDLNLKPYACILLYNYYDRNQNLEACLKLVSEMEYYQDNFEVVKFLFKFYGRSLHDPNNRVKLMKLGQENPMLEKENPLRFNYFNFVAETYNFHFAEGRKFLANIKGKHYSVNPEYHYVWKDSLGNDIQFEARIVKTKGGRYKDVKLTNSQQIVRLIKGNYDAYPEGKEVQVVLHFYLYGLMAEIRNKRIADQ